MTHRFVINREKWANGHTMRHASIGVPMLLHAATDSQCCVGFYAEACGVPRWLLKNVSTLKLGLEEMYFTVPPVPADALSELYDRNDSTEGSLEDRERDLSRIFLEHGFEVEFVGEYPSPPAPPTSEGA